MMEPDVTLTDYLLTVECAILAARLARRPTPHGRRRVWMILFFAAIGLAAALGGTVHGFVGSVDDGPGRILWQMSLLAIGAAAVSGTVVAGTLGGPYLTAVTQRAATLGLLIYGAVILFVHDAFWVTVVAYLPAAALLLAMVLRHRRGTARGAEAVAWGLGLTFVAAGVQQLRLGLHPVYFDHNALYHGLQAVALILVYVGFRVLLQPAHRSAD